VLLIPNTPCFEVFFLLTLSSEQAADQKVEAERRAKAEKEAAEAREAERIRKVVAFLQTPTSNHGRAETS
jgi:hypothetical protein